MELYNGARIKLKGFEGAYDPKQPTGIWIAPETPEEYGSILFDDHVRFAERSGGGIPARPHKGFLPDRVEVLSSPLCADCERWTNAVDYLCEECRASQSTE